MNFDRIYNQVKIAVTMKVERTLMVGSGAGDIAPTGVDMPQIKLTQLDDNIPMEVPYIPGSSLKGAVRAVCEMLVRTYLGNDKKIICYDDVPLEKGCCGSNGEPLCMMCDTFGDTNRMSKVAFDDAFLKSIDNLLDTVQHRAGIKISRKSGTVEGRALFKIEFIPKGTEFEFNILCTNILASELKLLLLAMRLYNDGRFKLGGQKSRGMGAVSFTPDKVTMYLPKLYRQSPFEHDGTGYTWLQQLPAELGKAIVFQVPQDKWTSVVKAKDKVRKLIEQLYPLKDSNSSGTAQVEVILRGEGQEKQQVGVFSLDLAGKVEGVAESGNGLEYVIEPQNLTSLFDRVYQAAFDFLGDVQRQAPDDEPHRALGKAEMVVIPLGNLANLTVAKDTEPLHAVLVWLRLAKMLIEA